jgi:hypothetical protein
MMADKAHDLMPKVPFEIELETYQINDIACAAEPSSGIQIDQQHENSDKRVADVQTDFNCHWAGCNEQCGNLRQLVIHVNEHVSPTDSSRLINVRFSGMACAWENCWNKHFFTDPARLLEHMRVHTLEKPFIVKLK